MVSDMLNNKGVSVCFESDAYHLKTFCKENDLGFKVVSRDEDFDSL